MPARRKPHPGSHFEKIKKQWISRHIKTRTKLHKKHKKALKFASSLLPEKETLTSSAIGLLMLSLALPASTALAEVIQLPQENEEKQVVKTKESFIDELKQVVGEDARILSPEEESKAAGILSNLFSMDVKPDIGGLRLNRTFGVIGAEQHLMRYPGDTMVSHLLAEDAANKMIYSSGMAPGRGAWGYFTKSREAMTQKDVERERWYIAVQTYEAPNYNQRLSQYRDFFKFRKMLVVNPQTGNAIVADIADAGPAVWTGKHLGGSPEVMYHIGYGHGSRKGPVLYFFIEDPDDTIPLGPINI